MYCTDCGEELISESKIAINVGKVSFETDDGLHDRLPFDLL